MDFLLIGESKIKVTLSDAEIKEYNLSDFLKGINTHFTRRSFWRILGEAKKKVGFDAAKDKVLIQFYRTPAIGCEVFVTKLGILAPESARLVAGSDKVTLLSRTETVYGFDTLDDLVSAARSIRSHVGNYESKSEVYRIKSAYYLIIEEYGKGDETSEFPQIMEFGNRLTAEIASFVREHGEPIYASDAVNQLSEADNAEKG